MDVKFCGKLKELRKELNLSQKEVAKKINVVESCYANWEQGRTEPSIQSIRKIAEIFDCSIQELFD